MTERKGQGLHNRLARRLKNSTDANIGFSLFYMSDKEFDEIMDNVMKDNQRLTTSVTDGISKENES